jgi:hypothetical protein
MNKRVLLFALFLLFVGGACSEQGFSNKDKTEIAPLPDIEVSPLELDFGDVRSDGEETRTFTVTNKGQTTLHVEDIVISGDGFVILSPEIEFLLDIDEEREIAVAFSPTLSYENYGEAIVASDDPDEAEVVVDLLGFGAVPELLITPDTFDFGLQEIPCPNQTTLLLENVGIEPLEINGMAYKAVDGQMSLIDTNVLPLILESNETTTVDVLFDPLLIGATSGSLTVDSTDPRGAQTASQEGEGIYGSTVTDDFEVPDNPPVDILFAVDQSCSMDTITQPLATAFSDFITQINSVTQGWHIGVVTEDDGCFNGGVLTETSTDYESTFEWAVNTGGCTGGHPSCDTEALLKLSNTALQNTYTNGCNDNFLRSGAMLHIIVVSDEKERSGVAVGTYLNAYSAYVTTNSLLKVSAIVDINGQCGDGSGAGIYDDAATWTNGEILDVCTSDWANKTADLAMASLTAINEYALTDTPDPTSIIVTVDGTQWTQDWHYDSTNNTIIFDIEMSTGQIIEVDYGVLSSCP